MEISPEKRKTPPLAAAAEVERMRRRRQQVRRRTLLRKGAGGFLPRAGARARARIARANPIRLRDVRRAEAEYASDVMRWGGRNLQTVRSLGRWQDAKAAWEGEKARRRAHAAAATSSANPHLLTISNPARPSRAAAAAVAAFQAFHGKITPRVNRVRRPPGAPAILVALGDLREIVYAATRGARRGPAWIHKFGRGAKLAADPSGKHLWIVRGRGSRVRVDWARGIVG